MTSFQERIAGAGSSSVAFVGLSRGAGKTTALRHAIEGLVELGRPFGIASAGRRDEDLEAMGGPASLKLEMPEGCIVATTLPALERATAGYETLVRIPSASSLGQVIVARVVQAGEVEVVGPGTGPELQKTVETVRQHVDGPVLIEGSITRKAFSAPGVAEHLVLALGAGLAPSIERIIPAARYYLDLFGAPLAPLVAKALFERCVAGSRCLLVGRDWAEIDSFHWQVRDNAPSFLGRADMKPAHAIVPQIITDELVVPLLREGMKLGLVVRDPMRNALSPVYSSAWDKRGGGVSVIHRAKVLAIAVNPVNPTGPDMERSRFLSDLAEGLADVPVHDVVQEAEALLPKKRWFGWA